MIQLAAAAFLSNVSRIARPSLARDRDAYWRRLRRCLLAPLRRCLLAPLGTPGNGGIVLSSIVLKHTSYNLKIRIRIRICGYRYGYECIDTDADTDKDTDMAAGFSSIRLVPGVVYVEGGSQLFSVDSGFWHVSPQASVLFRIL